MTWHTAWYLMSVIDYSYIWYSIHTGETPETMVRGADMIRNAGIRISTGFIIGRYPFNHHHHHHHHHLIPYHQPPPHATVLVKILK